MLFPAEHVAPPKKPPRPGAQCQVSSLACLNTGDSYNDGVKVHTHTCMNAWSKSTSRNTHWMNEWMKCSSSSTWRDTFTEWTQCMFWMLGALIFTLVSSFLWLLRLSLSLPSPSPPFFSGTLPYCWPLALAGKQHTVCVCLLCVLSPVPYCCPTPPSALWFLCPTNHILL